MTQWNRRWRTTKASKINKFWNNIKNPHERYCTFRIKKKTVLSSCLFATICFLWPCNMQSLGSSYLHTFHINFLHNLTWQRAFFGKLSTNFAWKKERSRKGELKEKKKFEPFSDPVLQKVSLSKNKIKQEARHNRYFTVASRAWSDRGRPGSKPGPKASVSLAIGRAGQAIKVWGSCG